MYHASENIWQKKGATLSDKTARKEFGLAQEEIEAAIRSGKLQYRMNSVFGNPFLRLIRSEVEAFVIERKGCDFLTTKKVQKELAEIAKEIIELKRRLDYLENRKAELTTKQP